MSLFYESLEPFSNKDENLEPQELLDEGWFFGNLLHQKKRMLRSYSDPCTSSNTSHEISTEKSYEETYESIKKLSAKTEPDRPSLIRTPSLPEKGRDCRTKKSSGHAKRTDLQRAPSLPSFLGDDEFQDEESEFSMGKLIRQASLNHSDRGTPIKSTPKSTVQRSTIPKHSPQKKLDSETTSTDSHSDMKPKYLKDQMIKMQKSFSDLKIDNRRGFKDSNLSNNRTYSNTNFVSTYEEYEEKNTKRTPYMYEASHGTSSAPPIPKWVGKRPKEDMKAQLKFWARAVASNVRQEC